MEPVWQLPINSEHRDSMKCKYADLHNAEKGRYGGASSAAAFIEYFIDKDVNWIHLDIAGYNIIFSFFDYKNIRPSSVPSSSGVYSAGATGFGTQLILKYLYNHCYPQPKNNESLSSEDKGLIEDKEITEELEDNKNENINTNSEEKPNDKI